MISMTGFASRQVRIGNHGYRIQLKSWNNRYLELALQLPSSLQAMERPIRQLLEASIRRGKVDCQIRPEHGGAAELQVNLEQARQGVKTLRRLARACRIFEPVRLSHLLSLEGVLQADRHVDQEGLWEGIRPELQACIADFNQDRQTEGQATRADISAQLDSLDTSIETIAAFAPGMEAAIEADLRRRFNEVLGSSLDETRILTETAAYLARYTINEELVRFRAHLTAFRAAMDEAGCGKKLDFICQELNREANTIGSKSAFADISRQVIDIKEAIENIREQVRNIE